MIVLDTTGKTAGSATVISYNPDGNYYTLNFQYANSEKFEQLDVPEQRIMINVDITNAVAK